MPSLNANNPLTEGELVAALSNFQIDGKLAIACSGGVDSMCLTYMAAKNFDVIALIIDHGLREESKEEAAKTAKILDALGIENQILSEDRAADSNISSNINSNVQAQARQLRFDLLTSFCKENGIDALATAHHAEDNAETVLLKLSRGSGVDGLTGILPESEMDGVRIIRPLLAFTKSQLQECLLQGGIQWVEDPTNGTDKYKRNKLRHLLAEIEDAELVTSRLNDTAENMRRVRDYLELQTQAALAECFDGEILDIQNFGNLHDEIAYRVLVQIVMAKAQPKQRPRFEKIKSLKTALLNGQVRTLAGLSFRPQDSRDGADIVIKLDKEI